MTIHAVGDIIGGVAEHFKTVFQGVFAHELAEIEAHVEAVDVAVAVRVVGFFHARGVTRIGNVTLNHHGSFARNDEEIGTCAEGIPAEVGERHVVVHLVVEREAEQIDLAAVGRIERYFTVNVLEVERQPVL